MKKNKLILGSAMWGWSIKEAEVFQMLDYFYDQGYRAIDTATNYPINKKTEDFRLAEKLLEKWIKLNKIKDLQLICKYGSINNLFTPEHNLSPSFTLISIDDYENRFGENVDTFMIHWDNRADKKQIDETFQSLLTAQAKGWKLGLSGIKNPSLHAAIANKYKLDFSIQIKHNPFESALAHYQDFRDGSPRFIAYGTTGGGVKLNADYKATSSISLRGKQNSISSKKLDLIKEIIEKTNQNATRTKLSEMYQVGILNACYHPEIQGLILGCSSLAQLKKSIEYFNILQKHNYQDVFEALNA